MKKIITTVGTSLLMNALGENATKNLDFLRTKGLPFKDRENREPQIKNLKKELQKYIEETTGPISAEIDSLIKITNEMQDDCEVYLIATDTILSPLCAEYIQKWFEQNDIKNISRIHFRTTKEFVIEGLQVKQKDSFEKNGLTNLFNMINSIAGGYWGNVVFNITGGYKALIPYMSLAAQINNVPAYYNFQESKDDRFDLLKIPNIPINVDFDLFEKYWKEIEQIQTTGEKIDDYEFTRELESIIETEDNFMMLSALGSVLWERYKSKFFIFYSPDEVWIEINTQKDIGRILKTKFWNKQSRNSKTERKQEHYVFDDGNNNNRIYFFEQDEKIYLYKTFQNEENARKFIDDQINREDITKRSKPRKITIEQ